MAVNYHCNTGPHVKVRPFLYICIMAEDEKKDRPKKERKKKYDARLAVKGSFMDLIKATLKDAEDKSEPKK